MADWQETNGGRSALSSSLAKLSFAEISELRRCVTAYSYASAQGSVNNSDNSQQENLNNSQSLYVGLLSRSATQEQLQEIGKAMTGLAQVSLKVNPDGTRYSFMNFHTFEYAESAKAQLEDLKERLIDADDFSLFDFDTKVKFRDPRISTLNAKPTGIYVENLNPTVTPRDLMIIGTDHLSQCGFVGAIVRNDLKTGVNFAIFNFNSHEGAERAKLILTQMKYEEMQKSGSKIFSMFSRIDFAFRRDAK